MSPSHRSPQQVTQHNLSPQQARQLLHGAQLNPEPTHLATWLPRGMMVLAAALGGMGVVMWVAANWETWGRVGHFALLQGLVLATGLGAASCPGARAPLGLLALLGIGALFAYFGQTYQTGADPWQLFALWAVLALPLCLGARSDVLWAPWALVVMTAIVLWTHTYGGYQWSLQAELLRVYLLGWTAMLVLAALLSPALQLYTGAGADSGAWSFRTAVILAVNAITTTAFSGLFQGAVLPHFYLGLLVLSVAAAALCTQRTFDVFALSAVALSLNALLVCGLLVIWLQPSGLGRVMLIGLFAAGLLAASVSGILKLARHYSTALPSAKMTGANARMSANTTALPNDARPWPVVLLTAIGAWFAAIPLLGALLVYFLEVGVFKTRPVPYIIGCLVLTTAAVVLRAKGAPLFVEQLAVPALLVGGGTLAMGVYRDLHETSGALVMLAIVTGVAVVVPKTWLRVLLGSAAAGLLCQALLTSLGLTPGLIDVLMVLHGLLVVWLAALWLQERSVAVAALLAACRTWGVKSENQSQRGQFLPGLQAHSSAMGQKDGEKWVAAADLQPTTPKSDRLIDAMATGWLLTTMVGLALVAGATFLVGGAGGSNSRVGEVLMLISREGGRSWKTHSFMQAGSSVLVLAAATVGALAWPSLRQWLLAVVALVLAVLAWFMPMLGAALLALAITAIIHRWRLVGACALTASWIVGGFYYQLQWPLADKALLLLAASAVLGAGIWLTFWLNQRMTPSAAVVQPQDANTATTNALRKLNAQAWFILTGTLATLLVANAAIWQKQEVIAHGKPIYMALLPVDPRSLMQGDYMQLHFAALEALNQPLLRDMAGNRPHMVIQPDARGVVTVQRMHTPDQPLTVNEMLLELRPKNGRWAVVTDAWFFKEGTGARWQAAKYGEFRVLPDGRALLVGLADEALRPITQGRP